MIISTRRIRSMELYGFTGKTTLRTGKRPARDKYLYVLRLDRLPKSPYKLVANCVQNRGDWLAVLHVIGDISIDVIGRGSYRKRLEFVVLCSDPIRYFVRYIGSACFGLPRFQKILSASVVVFRNFSCAMTCAMVGDRGTPDKIIILANILPP